MYYHIQYKSSKRTLVPGSNPSNPEMNAGIPPVVLQATKKHTATLVFLHGLGDNGFGWAGALNMIKPSNLKVICPTAPMMPVTLNGGASMPAWYDIRSLDERDPEREDMEGVAWSVDLLHKLVKMEEMHGVKSDRVMIGGFSQGGAVSLRAALTFPGPLAGCVALSCYLPGDTREPADLGLNQKVDTAVFQAHGDQDQVVTYKRGRLTGEVVENLVKNHKFVTYPGMGHEANQEELEDIKSFINERLS